MSSKRTILLLIPNLDFGGAQRSFSKLSIELTNHYYVYVGVFNTFTGIAYPYGGTLLDLNISGADTISGKLTSFWNRVAKVKKLKKEYNIDVCISFLEGADYVNILSKGKEKVIVSIRGSKKFDAEISGWLGMLRKKILMPLLYKKADVVVAVSEGIKQEMIYDFKLNAAKIRTIYNFYDLVKIRNLAQEPLEGPYKSIFQLPVIINSGRLHRQKEHAALLEAFSKTKSFAKLVIIGEGNLIAELRNKAQKLNMRTYWWGQELAIDDTYDVYFIGYQENPFKFIQKATLFAFTSSWEGFPNALAEAMICGVPVLTTDCPTGPREILAPGTKPNRLLEEAETTKFGVLMPLLNQVNNGNIVQLWAQIMDTLITDAALRSDYAANAQIRMLDFTPETIFNQWEQIIQSEY